MEPKFLEAVRAAFPPGGGSLTLGAPVRAGECHPEPLIGLPLGMVNRHGLVAGATGTGKTKSIQLLAEQLSAAGVPVFLADVKGDVSGLGAPGESNEKVQQRAKETGCAWKPAACPVEFLSLTGQLFRGDSGDATHPLFTSTRKSDVSAVAHLRSYKDLTESTNLELGLSFARGHNDVGTDFLTRLYGVDATLRWKPLRRSIYRSFVARSEFVWSRRQQIPATVRSFGYYVSADYQFGRRWFLGGRYDSSERALRARADRGASAVLTYWPSEFSQLRWQYRRTDYFAGRDANELLMQVQFVLGAHGAHPF